MKLCVLVLIGVNEQDQKKLLAISDGVRESTQRWHELLLDLKERSFNAPKVATRRWFCGTVGGTR